MQQKYPDLYTNEKKKKTKEKKIVKNRIYLVNLSESKKQ